MGSGAGGAGAAFLRVAVAGFLAIRFFAIGFLAAFFGAAFFTAFFLGAARNKGVASPSNAFINKSPTDSSLIE